jgi:hypothetical protein
MNNILVVKYLKHFSPSQPTIFLSGFLKVTVNFYQRTDIFSLGLPTNVDSLAFLHIKSIQMAF